MRDAVLQILQSLEASRPLAYCRLVETSGSTPQKAGAVMLVFADGSQHGTLGGGCVEAEVKRRAITVLDSGSAEVAEFQLDHDYGWDDGLICGGRMTVAIFPVTGEKYRAYFETPTRSLAAGQGVVEALVYSALESPEAKGVAGWSPCMMLFDASSNLLGLVDGADDKPQLSNSESLDRIKRALPDLADRPRPTVAAGVAYLPIMPRYQLIIVGAGHIGQAVASLAHSLDFDVSVVDDRVDCATEDRFPNATRRVVGPMSEVLPRLDVSPITYCLIVTRGHNHDQEALFLLAERPARYIGLIGSRRKIKLIFDNLVSEGIRPESLERVFAPIGIDIGSQTVAEIAVSVAAELVAHRNLGSVPGRPNSIPVRTG